MRSIVPSPTPLAGNQPWGVTLEKLKHPVGGPRVETTTVVIDQIGSFTTLLGSPELQVGAAAGSGHPGIAQQIPYDDAEKIGIAIDFFRAGTTMFTVLF